VTNHLPLHQERVKDQSGRTGAIDPNGGIVGRSSGPKNRDRGGGPSAPLGRSRPSVRNEPRTRNALNVPKDPSAPSDRTGGSVAIEPGNLSPLEQRTAAMHGPKEEEASEQNRRTTARGVEDHKSAEPAARSDRVWNSRQLERQFQHRPCAFFKTSMRTSRPTSST